MKALAILPAALAIGATPNLAVPSPYTLSFAAVPKLECGARGSGVRISNDIVITARHVTENRTCTINGAAVTLAHNDTHGHDFSAMRGNYGFGIRAIYSCEGINEGQRYYALGYAHGGAPTVEVLLGTSQKGRAGQILLKGTVFPGMSGGGVFTEAGALVAIVNARGLDATGAPLPWAYVLPLSETYLCAGLA